MAKVISQYNAFTTAEITGSAGRWILPASVMIYADAGAAISEDNTHADNAIRIDGQAISSDTDGIHSEAASSDITVTAHGAVVGANAGIFTSGANESVTNAGTIDGKGNGIQGQGESLLVDNSGTIAGANGISFSEFGGNIVNRFGGIISGTVAIATNMDDSEVLKTVNDGLIDGSTAAYTGLTDGIDVIINHGTIRGNVSLGGGDDVFDTKGGKFKGEVFGGAGSDTYLIGRPSTDISESGQDAGTDTVKSGMSYTLGNQLENLVLLGKAGHDGTGNGLANTLTGNRGDNTLNGKAGADTLDGGLGNDNLTGGADADLFIFRTGDGHDTITDFDGKLDTMDLSGMKGIRNFSDLKQNHIEVAADHVTIVNGADRIVLEGVAKSDLTHDHFIFL
jgi:Ca2+-binding RTX toxin-like protein